MPCARLENGAWPHPGRLPLGAGWSGHCTAAGHEGEIPAQDILETLCNLGYAGTCPWTPQERAWDAIRFSVAAPAASRCHEGEREEGEREDDNPAKFLRLIYVCERLHRPVDHGELKFDLQSASWLERHEDTRIQKMAECFLESYLKKRT
jgi:hypothetical protein